MPDNFVFAVDTDGGIDDAIALMMLIGAGRKIDFITTTFGNVDVEQATQNILDTLAICNADIPVHKGASDPTVGERIDAVYVHGQDGLGGVERPQHLLKPSGETAHNALRDVLRKAELGGPKLQILTIGPLTNLAEVLREEPDLGAGIDRIWTMGGTCHGRGNVTPAAEFNILCDPEAAKMVLSQAVNTTMIRGSLAFMMPSRGMWLMASLIVWAIRSPPNLLNICAHSCVNVVRPGTTKTFSSCLTLWPQQPC
ncbi:nucleoside hydrolase [Pseudovibrio denitrificans]|uniref:nucleoside hydrolase n=1 Tax=Pseudovibrio denitrificans TaxID=258256 RepID=UPI000AC74DDF|nr:nucleoside hydrolase [Pseudovibrio denitrificans]